MTLLLLSLIAHASPWGEAKRACRGDDTKGCAATARVLGDQGDERAVKLLLGVCDSDTLAACGTLARWSLRGGGPSALGPDDARVPLTVLCDSGRRDACADLGWILEHGHGGEPDPVNAAIAYRLACRAGSAVGCEGLRSMDQPIEPIEPDSQASACATGDGAACVDLAAAAMGTERATDLEVPLASGCEAGSAEACGLLGKLWITGRGRSADGRAGLDLLERACALGAAPSCIGAADMWLTGMVGDRDEERAHKLLHTGCELGEQRACDRDHDH
ncbi:MAG: TPR repeat protein [Myxococcota bacterium]|jgi:TPR repeat protein